MDIDRMARRRSKDGEVQSVVCNEGVQLKMGRENQEDNRRRAYLINTQLQLGVAIFAAHWNRFNGFVARGA
jgi:hypothetical protein